MQLVILQVPDCPNAAVLETRLAPLLAARADIVLTRQLVTSQADAERLGMTGSPTLLADGVDPFAAPAQPPSSPPSPPLSSLSSLSPPSPPSPAASTATSTAAPPPPPPPPSSAPPCACNPASAPPQGQGSRCAPEHPLWLPVRHRHPSEGHGRRLGWGAGSAARGSTRLSSGLPRTWPPWWPRAASRQGNSRLPFSCRRGGSPGRRPGT